MLRKITGFFLLAVLFCAGSVAAFGIEVTGKELGLAITGEFNRAAALAGTVAVAGSVEVNERYAVNGGIAFGADAFGAEVDAFAGLRVSPWREIPLSFSLAYMLNAAPEYDTVSHTALPAVAFNGKWAGIAVGAACRFTSFFGEPAIFEPVLSFSAYVNVVNNEVLRIGIVCKNFDDFYAGNMGAYSVGVESLIRLNEQWALASGITLLQSGSVGLSANFYGAALRGAVRFTW